MILVVPFLVAGLMGASLMLFVRALYRRQYHAELLSERALEPDEGDALAYMASLKTRRQTEPITAWRFATIVRAADGWRFAPLHVPHHRARNREHGTFGVEDEAVCGTRGSHKAPSPSCSCGFYSLKHKPTLSQRWIQHSYWLLEVELYGRVIVHEFGYRAQFQRVRRILAGFCWCQEPAEYVIASRTATEQPHLDLYCGAHRPVHVEFQDFSRFLGVNVPDGTSERLEIAG